MTLALALALAAAAPTPPAAAAERPRLLVMDVTGQGVGAEQAAAFTDAIVATLSKRGPFEVMSSKDVRTLLGVERQKALLGLCESDDQGCGKAANESLNARFMLSGQLSRVGSAFQLTLQMLDTAQNRSPTRGTRLASSFEELLSLVPWAAAEATGSPLPPPPSRVLPVSLLAAGGATVFAGGVVGLLAISRTQQLNDELCPGGVPADGRCTGVNLRERTFYVAQDGALATQKWLAVGLAVTGVLLAGAGWWLMPPDAAQGRTALFLVPRADGLALAGSF